MVPKKPEYAMYLLLCFSIDKVVHLRQKVRTCRLGMWHIRVSVGVALGPYVAGCRLVLILWHVVVPLQPVLQFVRDVCVISCLVTTFKEVGPAVNNCCESDLAAVVGHTTICSDLVASSSQVTHKEEN
jgi:hypothetical protein